MEGPTFLIRKSMSGYGKHHIIDNTCQLSSEIPKKNQETVPTPWTCTLATAGWLKSSALHLKMTGRRAASVPRWGVSWVILVYKLFPELSFWVLLLQGGGG